MKIIDLLNRYHAVLLPLCILFIFLFSLTLRGIPALYTPEGGFLPIYDSDTWYTLRQVEVMVHSFPLYNWFDPMTAYPVGKAVGWGPLFPFLAALLCLTAGATSRVALVGAAMWAGPLLGACLVPVMYFLGKIFWNRWAGILAAALASFVSFRLFFMSGYGIADHHIAEALFAALFLLAYAASLAFLREHQPSLSDHRSLLVPSAFAVLCGAVYFAGIAASPTVVIILMVTGIYTAVQIIADTLGGRPVLDLLLLNTGTGAAALVLLLAFGTRAEGLSLGAYSAGQLLACAGFIGGTLAFALVSLGSRGNRALFLGLCALLAVAALAALFIVPALGQLGGQLLQLLSLEGAFSTAIQEMHPWNTGLAWQNFNLFLVLGAGGLLLLILGLRKTMRRGDLLLGVWAASFLFITLLHSRFEYYLAVPLILLSAFCVVRVVGEGLPGMPGGVLRPAEGRGSSGNEEDTVPARGSGKKKGGKKKPKATGVAAAKGSAGSRYPALAAAAVLAMLAAGTGISLWVDIQSGMQVPYREIPPDWLEALGWMDTRTPSPGVDYYGPYNATGYTYPPESYGVMATWDAGHWITFFGRRIPNVNPFQDNLDGGSGGAAYLLAPTEEQADRILDRLGTRFVVTDIWTATEKFEAQIPWVDPSVNITPYMSGFLLPDTGNPSRLSFVDFYDDAFYRSMVVRLQVFDGSLAIPGTVQYIEYSVRNVPGPGETSPVAGFAAVISKIQDRDAGEAFRDAEAADADRLRNVHTTVLSDRPDRPIRKVPAVTRYRLVHESPSKVTWELYDGEPVSTGISYVKVFEYVKGARIRGTGIIELPLVTDTGRTFTYMQESVNGEFVVPYSTRGNPYDVKAAGPYHIRDSAVTFDVSEEDVISGNTVA